MGVFISAHYLYNKIKNIYLYGKKTIFNGLTGASQDVGNWRGVKEEKKDGSFLILGNRLSPTIYQRTSLLLLMQSIFC